MRLTNGTPQIVDHLAWKHLGANTTFGNHPDVQPVFRSTLVKPTPGSNNLGRLVPVCINEFAAANSIQSDPADGAKDDWFEIYNGSLQTVDLGGLFITDNAGQPTKFRAPSNGQYRIAPGGFLLGVGR